MNRIMLWLVIGLLAAGARAAEVGVEFRFHPDASGQRTVNQEIEAERDDGEFEADISQDGESREIEITAEQFEAMVELVRQALRDFRVEEGEQVEGPRVEVMLEYEGEDREIEITLIYPAGEVPEPYVQLQEQYFTRTFR